MIIKLTTSDKTAIQPLHATIKQHSQYATYIERLKVIVAPKFSNTQSIQPFASLIKQTIDIDTPYQLASKKYKPTTEIAIGSELISNDSFHIIAGPCSVESEEQINETAAFLAHSGIRFIRGGAYKPRTSPYSFQGLGRVGLQYLSKAAKKHGLLVVTEIMDISLLDEVMEYADVLQVGSRNMQNFFMLKELSKISKPILLKRGMHAKVTEWLLAAEYLLSGGNENIILCERGIRSFDPESRNVMDIGVIPLIKELSHLPIIADPSHGTGSASRVLPLSLASIAAGANGIMVEIHPNPKEALSDSAQALSFDQFAHLLKAVKPFLPSEKTSVYAEQDILKLQTL
jgi:3-deoxy-7-phosphoheptulonate synthase